MVIESDLMLIFHGISMVILPINSVCFDGDFSVSFHWGFKVVGS